MILALLLATLVLASLLGTAMMRRYALRRAMIDVPNVRSSHTRPTPRGGGVAIVLTALAGLFLGGVLVAMIGYADDLGHVPVLRRVLVHLLAASLLVAVVGTLPPLQIFGTLLVPGVAGSVVAVLFIAWTLNLYNFMDGIDGIAGIEAVTVCSGAAALLWFTGEGELAALVTVYGAASLGFLFWNWPPARIFMGDAGSGFLGFSLAGLALVTWTEGGFPPFAWLILLGVFVVDASVTLLRRVWRGERFYQAHRCHAYQHAVRRFGGHRPVTLAVAAVNVLWLLPLAWLATLRPDLGLVLVLLAWTPLVAMAWALGSGVTQAGDR